MGRTLGGRLTLTALLVALASVLLTACLGSVLFSAYYLRQRQAELVTATEKLAKLVRPRAEEHDTAAITGLLRGAGEAIGGRACLFDGNDVGLIAAGRRGEPGLEEAAARYYHETRPLISSVRPVRVECEGWTYTATAPVQSANGTLLGLVVMRCPVAGVKRMVAAQWASAGLASAGAALLAIILALAASKTLARPIAEVGRAAEQLAAGDFAARVPVEGPAELADLAATINRTGEQLEGLFGALSAERGRLADVLQSMSEGLLAWDAEGRLLLVNEPAKALLDLPADTSPGRPLAELVAAAEVRRALAEGGTEPLAVGAKRVRVESAPLSDGQGRVAVVVDVTEAERLQRMRVDFVANASHQLRTPLTSVRGYLEAVADGTAEGADERARCLAVALDQVGLLQRLVDQLLQLSRLQAGARPLEAVPLDLAQVARRAAEHLEPQAADRGVQVHVEADESPTFGDPDLLVQAVHNLLDNAIRHSPPGATVTVGLRATPGGYELAVADQGDGLGATEPELLWQRFQSAGGNGGAGLGLPIAKEIVEAHGGTVFARAGDDGGAVFGFRLPREAGDPGE